MNRSTCSARRTAQACIPLRPDLRKRSRGPNQSHGVQTGAVGIIRRECLDHVIVFGEPSLYRYLQSFLSGRTGTSPAQIGGLGAGCFPSSLRAPRRIKASSARFHPRWPGPLRGPTDGHRGRTREPVGIAEIQRLFLKNPKRSWIRPDQTSSGTIAASEFGGNTCHFRARLDPAFTTGPGVGQPLPC